MTKLEIIKQINENEDFINSPKHENSLLVFEKKHPEGAKDDTIAKALMISEEDLLSKFSNLIEKIRSKMGL